MKVIPTLLKQLCLRVERNRLNTGWLLWIAANIDFTLGHYYVLYDNSCIDFIIQHSNGTETVEHIKGDSHV